jgi:hypothetical protein
MQMGKNKAVEKKNYWKITASVLGALAAFFGVWAYFFPNPWAGRQPEFKFTYEGTGKPYYEVAEGLAYADENNEDLLPFYITVEVLDYSGKQYSGEMDVVIEWLDGDQNKQQELVGQWTNFRSEHQTPVKIELFPNKLFQYASLPAGIYTYTWNTEESLKGRFDIVVRYTDGSELVRETVTVVHTPWYHQVLLDSGVIQINHPATAHIKFFNLGEPAKFNIVALLYDTSAPVLSSLTDDESWWVQKTWDVLVDEFEITTDAAIGTDEDYETTVVFPADVFQEGHTYAVDVMVTKELPYVKFIDPKNTWDNSSIDWRYRDNPIYLSIFVLK